MTVPAGSSPDALLASLGKSVRAHRRRRGWTLERTAGAAGLSSRFLTDVEAGRGNISVSRLSDLARALGCRIADLLVEPGALRVALLGLRGAGKSTVGRLLSDAIPATFVELDQRVEEAAGLPLAEIFAVHGEAYYRRVEREALRRVVAEEGPLVIAVGGSLVTDPETYALLAGATTTVWLRARPEEHMGRVAAQGDLRPMARRANALAELEAILAAREPLYARADHAVATSGLSPALVADRVRRLVTAA
jgi:XRE family transcriptional regulator, aerobic/anaerobic benzoate catabolism transcriptional regulator